MGNKPIIMPDGVGFGDETLSNYDEGTWTPGEASKGNMGGTGAYGTATYTRIGNIVFARVMTISGYTVTTAGSQTFLAISTTGLPGVANGTAFYGSVSVRVGSSPFEPLPASIIDPSAGSTNITIYINTVSGLGVVNGDALEILAFQFQYTI